MLLARTLITSGTILKARRFSLRTQKKEVDKPFAQEFELKQKTARLEELTHELAMNTKDDAMEIGGNVPPEEAVVSEMER